MAKVDSRHVRLLLAIAAISSSMTLAAMEATPAVQQHADLLQPIPANYKVFAAVVDDIDSNGLLDILTTDRTQGITQVLYQKSPRKFEAGPEAKILGFHPNGLTRFPGSERRYVLSAEGDAALKVLGLDEQGGIKEIANRPHEGAFASTGFTWPGWGTSLVVAPYEGSTLSLFRNFDPNTAQAEKEFNLGKPEHPVPGEVTVADINGDGIPELLYTTRRSRTLWQISYPNDNQAPQAVPIWKAPVGAPRHLVVADINGDKALDILLPLESERRIAVLINDGKGHFTPGEELPVPTNTWAPQRLAISENRDGSLLLVATTEKSLVVYRVEKGNPYRFKTVELPLETPVNQVLLLRDMDGDGEMDLVFTLNRVKDSLQILYGPLWQRLAKEQEPNSASQLSPQPPKLESAYEPSHVLARVGDREITLEEFRKFTLQSGLGDESRTQAGQTKLLRLLIAQKLFEKAIQVQQPAGESPSPEIYAKAVQSLEEAHFPLPPLPDESALRVYYDANKEEFGIPETIRLIQIQFRNDRDQAGGPTARQRAERALQRIEAGEDFMKVAQELTENPRSAELGADRGFVARNAVAWLRDAVQGLQPGQRTSIVSSPTGYEILLLTDARPALLAEYAAVKTKVGVRWQTEQQQQARDRYIRALAEQFGVTVLEKGLENANPAKQK
ncbi:MAG: FG-GAP-like repeat-containing protein [Candidatus Competibacter denitrificans]